jgi:hypothetical protein
MNGPINIKSPNNISKGQVGFNSAFKGLKNNSDNTKGAFQHGVITGLQARCG